MAIIEKNSIGLVETSSIAAGMLAADTMLKTANVELILSRTICSGKFMVLVAGDVAAVQSSVQAVEKNLEQSIIDTFIIPNVHVSIFTAISGQNHIEMLNALGIVESFSVASLIEGADAAVKAAMVQLVEIRLAMALGGKAYFTITGDVAAVKSAVDAAASVISAKGMLVNEVVIPNPRPELISDHI